MKATLQRASWNSGATAAYWYDPDGNLTGSTGSSGPDSTSQGGGDSSGGYISYQSGPGSQSGSEVTLPWAVGGWNSGPGLTFPGNQLGFQAGDITTRQYNGNYGTSFIDAHRLASLGQGFDGPGLRQLANGFNNFALGVSVVVAAPVGGALAAQVGITFFTPAAIFYARYANEVNESL